MNIYSVCRKIIQCLAIALIFTTISLCLTRPSSALAADTVGLYNPANSVFHLSNTTVGTMDSSFLFGAGGLGWIPIIGDWDGDGKTDTGLYDPSTSVFYLRNSTTGGVIVNPFLFGAGGLGWIPFAGDWNGNGSDSVGLYNPATSVFYLRDTTTGGVIINPFLFGAGGLGWIPFAGDWNGNGTDTIGLYDPATSVFYLRNSTTGGVIVNPFLFGGGGLGWIPFAGDWNGNGSDSVGLYNPATSVFYLRDAATGGVIVNPFLFGAGGLGWIPLAGNWNGSPPPGGAAPTAEYGDAPNGGATGYAWGSATGNFPTLFASNGARALSIVGGLLGSATATVEKDANDPVDPDGVPNLINADSDDGLVSMVMTLISIPPPTTLTMNVTTSPGAPGGNYFLNVLIDLNMNGNWGGVASGGEQEWVVQNFPVTIMSDVITPVTPPAFGFSNGLILPDGAWMRVALTKEAVSANWTGIGAYTIGEIEDHRIELPIMGAGGNIPLPPPPFPVKPAGWKNPVLRVVCVNPNRFPAGSAAGTTINVSCDVLNTRVGAPGTFTYFVTHTGPGSTGQVNVANCTAPGGPVGGPTPIAGATPPALGLVPIPGRVTVTCMATKLVKAATPDHWTFHARAVDPTGVLITGGIVPTIPAEATGPQDFEELALPPCGVGSLTGGFTHFIGFSTVDLFGSINCPTCAPTDQLLVNLDLTGPTNPAGPGPVLMQQVQTTPGAMWTSPFTIHQLGTYGGRIMGVSGGCAFNSTDPLLNQGPPSVIVNVIP